MENKKWLVLLLAAVLCISLCACGDQTGQEPPNSENSSEQQTQQTPEPSENTDESTDAEDVGDTAVFARTQGTWRLDGSVDAASIYMDGVGGFQAFYADGALEFEGYLEYVDEYGDGNGRYDRYDMSGEWIDGFYFDSDTQFHIGNDEGMTYVLDGAEPLPAPPVLFSEWRFTGMEPLEAEQDYNGGYFYQDRTEDALTVITNCCFTTTQDEDESMEDYIRRSVQEITGGIPEELNWEENAEHSQRFTYPVYILSWQSGSSEDTHGYDAFFFMTDTHTYFYIFDTTIDNQAEMQETWYEVFGQMSLMELE